MTLMVTTTDDNLDDKIAEARRLLMQIPGVVGVGYGYKARAGATTQELSLVVFVREKKPLESLSPAEVVPREVLGIQTDVIRSPRLRKLVCELLDKFDPLVGGILISSLKHYLNTNVLAGTSVGTLGFFGTINSSSSRDNIVLLSNHHVIGADGGAVGDTFYQPRFTGGDGAYEMARNDMHPIGAIHNLGLEDNRDYAYPGEAARSHFVDCATVKINTNFSSWCGTNCGVKFANVLHDLVIGGAREVEGIARIRNSDLPSGGNYEVYKVGHRTGWTKGKIRVATADLVDPDDASIHHNQVMLIDELGPNCGGGAHFAAEGDSGAVIVDNQRRIIGLLFAATDTGFYAACHIHPVIDLLGITMISTQHRAGASGGATSLETALSLDGSGQSVARALALREEILSSPRGRAYRALAERHLDEVVHMVNHVRPVTVAWHRLHGPEFLSHVLHASRHAEYSVPRELQGLARDEALAHLLETFSRHGSAPLRADIERHAEEVCTMFSQIDDIETLAARLQKYDGAAKWMG